MADEKVPFIMLTADIPAHVEHHVIEGRGCEALDNAVAIRERLAEIACEHMDHGPHRMLRCEFEGSYWAWYYVNGVPRAVVQVSADSDTPLWTAIPGFLR